MNEKYSLKPEEIKILEDIGMQSQYERPIPRKDETEFTSFYYEVEDNNIVDLNLDNSGLKTFPENIYGIKSLKRLSLRSNQLKTIPESIGNLKSLQKFVLENNNLTVLPDSIGDLESLKDFNINGNKIKTLPDSIGNLKSLNNLNLWGLDLTTLPESIGQLESLQKLNLEFNKLTSLPKSIGNLKSLQELNLNSNQLRYLPKSIGGLTSLQKLYLRENHLSTLPESIGNLKSLQILVLWRNEIITLPEVIGNLRTLVELSLVQNLLIILPESIGNLKSLEKLFLADNKLMNLPETIGNLSSLKELGLGYNELSNVPRSIGKLENLELLGLENNKFTSLPGPIWPLKNLKKLLLDRNPWNEESQEILPKDIPAILDFCRKKSTINVFLSHAVADFDYFNIQKISEYLKEQSEIFQAYYCEEDLIGHIDDFMNEKIPDSQLLLFFASHKSVFNSKDCAHELELAKKHNIQTIPIKGANIKWEDLEKIGLNRDLGFEFNENDVSAFCRNLYDYIKKFKAEVNLFEPEEARIDKQLLNIKNIVFNLTESEELKEEVRKNLKPLEDIFKELNDNVITPLQYLQKLLKILFKNHS